MRWTDAWQPVQIQTCYDVLWSCGVVQYERLTIRTQIVGCLSGEGVNREDGEREERIRIGVSKFTPHDANMKTTS